MVTRRRKSKDVLKTKACVKGCACGSCEDPNPHLRGFLLAALGLVALPVSFGFMPEFDWVAKGWPILLVMFGIVLVAKAFICSRR